MYQLYCGGTNEEAHREGGGYRLQYFKFFTDLDRVKSLTSEAFAHYQGGVSRVFSGVTYEELDCQRLLMIGDPERIIAHIRWAQEFYGTNYLIFEVAQGGVTHDKNHPLQRRYQDVKAMMGHVGLNPDVPARMYGAMEFGLSVLDFLF